MGEKSRGKKIRKIILEYLVILMIGFFGSYFVSKHGFDGFLKNYIKTTPMHAFILFLTIVVSVILAIFLHVLIHEAGHLVAGLLSGYNFCSYRVMSFMLVKEDDKIRLKRYRLAGTGGQCLMSPPELVDGKFPVTLYNLGGPLSNLLLSVIVVIPYIAMNKIRGISQIIPYVSTFLLVFIIIGFLVALLNGIPMKTKDINNDGYNALDLRRDKGALRSFWIQLKVSEYISRGISLKDMPEEWFIPLSDEEIKNSMNVVISVYACNRLMDEQKFDEANASMKELLVKDSGMVGIHRNLLLCDRIYCDLLEENMEEAKLLHTKELQQFMKSMKTFPSVIRTEYAIALFTTEDIGRVNKFKGMFDKVAMTFPYTAEINSERELMEIADRIASERRVISVLS